MYERCKKYRYTEEILNATQWMTADGEILEPRNMDEEHLQNVLRYLYVGRDDLWLRCKNHRLIDQYENGEEFFQKVIRRSTIWKTLINALEKPNLDFNFEFEGGSFGKKL